MQHNQSSVQTSPVPSQDACSLVLPPEVSVVIPAYNAEKTLRLQLESLSKQVDPPKSFEIIVADNGSTDSTRTVAEEAAKDFKLPLRVVDASARQGTSYARNCGASHAAAEFLMFCDADDVVSEYWLDFGLKSFEYTELWTGAIHLLTDDEFATDTVASIRSCFDPGKPFRIPSVSQQTIFPILAGGNFGITASAYKSLNGFDETFPSNGEDNDFGFRANRNGIPVWDSPSVSIGYRGKWDPKVMAKLAFRSARSHATLVTRYGVRSQSPYPHTLPELLKIAIAPATKIVGIRNYSHEEYLLRINRWLGFTQGRIVTTAKKLRNRTK